MTNTTIPTKADITTDLENVLNDAKTHPALAKYFTGVRKTGTNVLEGTTIKGKPFVVTVSFPRSTGE